MALLVSDSMRGRILLAVLAATVATAVSPVPVAASGQPRASAHDSRLAAAPPVQRRPGWVAKIDRLVQGRPIGVSVREGDVYLYRHGDEQLRTPASNEKLLLSMAILDVLGPDHRLVTQAASAPPVAGVIPGDLWILGQGDPGTSRSRLAALARALVGAGVARVEGSVMGSTAYFERDWRARGWKRDFPRTQVALPTALTFEGNTAGDTHIRDPELRAAKAMTEELEDQGVQVAGRPGAGAPPDGLIPLAQVESKPLITLLEFTNRYSSNFYAEVLGKRLGAEAGGVPGNIPKGAAAIEAFAAEHGVAVRALDSSGLSYSNRVSPSGIVHLLDAVEDLPWGEALREALPEPGQGTLKGRLRRIEVHAKTGTLSGISALSGWVYLRQRGVWAEFSILSAMSKDQAVRIEDAIVRTLWRLAA